MVIKWRDVSILMLLKLSLFFVWQNSFSKELSIPLLSMKRIERNVIKVSKKIQRDRIMHGALSVFSLYSSFLPLYIFISRSSTQNNSTFTDEQQSLLYQSAMIVVNFMKDVFSFETAKQIGRSVGVSVIEGYLLRVFNMVCYNENIYSITKSNTDKNIECLF